jgi:hypothetical protein
MEYFNIDAEIEKNLKEKINKILTIDNRIKHIKEGRFEIIGKKHEVYFDSAQRIFNIIGVRTGEYETIEGLINMADNIDFTQDTLPEYCGFLEAKKLGIKKQRKKISESTRKAIYTRDGECVICKCPLELIKKPSLEHIIPFSKGGECTKENLALSCAECNRRRGSMMTLDIEKIWI